MTPADGASESNGAATSHGSAVGDGALASPGVPGSGLADDGEMRWRELWIETTGVLDGRATEARWLCEEASGAFGAEWLTVLEEFVGGRAVARLDAMVARYRAGEPLQYVLGHWSFRHLDLLVDRRVLIPRPETEEVVETALGLLRAAAAPSVGLDAGGQPTPRLVADIGTGSGAIALSLADELPIGWVEVWATDVSSEALAVARANLAGLGRRGGAVRLAEGSLFAALPAELAGRLSMVISNPPYVAVGSPDLEPIVGEWEPGLALFGGADGLTLLRQLVADAPTWLKAGGWLVCEIGADQGEAVRDLAIDAGFVQVEVRPDLSGVDRILIARRSSG